MNFLKRGLQSLWAKKGRSLLLIAVFSAILIFVLAGLTIRSAALVATENAQKSVGATVTLQANREQAFQQEVLLLTAMTKAPDQIQGVFNRRP